MAIYDDALKTVGIDISTGAFSSFGKAVDQFQTQTLGFDAVSLGKAIYAAKTSGINSATVNDILNVAKTAGLGRFGAGKKSDITGIGNGAGGMTPGTWDMPHYASDLVAHQPKFKFLFKVKFSGFDNTPIEYFVHKCDKPKVKFNHTEVNYYNFRTKVLTSVSLEPMSMTILDEGQNSAFRFFKNYLERHSMIGRGNVGINSGLGNGEHTRNDKSVISSSSSLPYQNQYGEHGINSVSTKQYGYSSGRSIQIQQFYGNGTRSNIYEFINPRIEDMGLDDLDMTSNDISFLNLTFSYDGLVLSDADSTTDAEGNVSHGGTSTSINSWGEQDIHKGGGIAGENAGENGGYTVNKVSIGGNNQFNEELSKEKTLGLSPINQLGNNLSNLTTGNYKLKSSNVLSSLPSYLSVGSTLSKSVSDTWASINSGKSLFG